MFHKTKCENIEVFISHPFGDVYISLDDWMEQGPLRKYLRPLKARCKNTGKRLPLSVVPFRYRNNLWSRLAIRFGWIENPWDINI